MLQSSECILGSKGLGDRGPKPEPGSDNGKAEERTWFRSSQEVNMTRPSDCLGLEETFVIILRCLGSDSREDYSVVN